MGFLANIAMDEGLADIVLKADTGAAMSPVEDFRYYAFRSMQMRYWEDVHYQYRSGLFDDDEFAATRQTWVGNLSLSSVREFWGENRNTYSPDFVAEVDEILRDLAAND
jgi:hypothetical protein